MSCGPWQGVHFLLSWDLPWVSWGAQWSGFSESPGVPSCLVPVLGDFHDPPEVWESEVVSEIWLVTFDPEYHFGLGEQQHLWDQTSREIC